MRSARRRSIRAEMPARHVDPASVGNLLGQRSP